MKTRSDFRKLDDFLIWIRVHDSRSINILIVGPRWKFLNNYNLIWRRSPLMAAIKARIRAADSDFCIFREFFI